MSAAVFCAISFKCTSGCFINLHKYCCVTLGIVATELSNFLNTSLISRVAYKIIILVVIVIMIIIMIIIIIIIPTLIVICQFGHRCCIFQNTFLHYQTRQVSLLCNTHYIVVWS